MIKNTDDLKKFVESYMSEEDDEFDKMVDKYVPGSGKADTLGGELLRSGSRIESRYYNDGDKAGEGYGNETVNPAVRFLIAKGNADVRDIAASLFTVHRESAYEALINELRDAILVQIEEENLLEVKNDEDMLSYRKPEDRDYEF